MAKEWDPCPYTPDVLIGNWNEERFDAKEISQGQSLPSPHDHYFQTTYKHAYSKSPREVPHVLKYPESKYEFEFKLRRVAWLVIALKNKNKEEMCFDLIRI